MSASGYDAAELEVPATGPMLSVVVPFYGVEDYLADCLESLRQQTLTDLEVLMIDDGSKDRSRVIAERYAAADPRFRLIVQENQGLGPARNTGAREAEGRYLAFVDSDDIVAPRAYSRMIRTLEASGSSFAAANAYRFSRAGDSYQSWTHRLAFAEERLRTHVTRFPELAMDRMAWNKVFRRTFWDRHNFQFPAIRYEDYPVTLRAHIEADTVDVLDDVVYFWRIRETTASITQNAHELSNLRDRLQSDLMVLEMLDVEGTPAIRRLIHTTFIDVDLVAFAEGLAQAEGPDRREFAEMARALAVKLHPALRAGGATISDAIHRALRAGQFDEARALTNWRKDKRAQDLLKSAVHRPSPVILSQLGGQIQSNAKRVTRMNKRRLRVSLTGFEQTPQGVRIRVRPLLRKEVLQRAKAGMVVTGAGNTQVPLPVETSWQDGALTVEGLLTDQLTALVPGGDDTFGLGVTLRLGPLHWFGRALLDADHVPGVLRLPNGDWLQPVTNYDRTYFGQIASLGQPARPRLVTQATADETGFDLVLEDATGEIVIERPFPTPNLVAPVTAGQVRAELAWASDDVADDPITGEVARRLLFRRTDGTEEPLALAVPPVMVQSGEHVFVLRPGADGYAEFVRRPAHAPADGELTEIILVGPGLD